MIWIKVINPIKLLKPCRISSLPFLNQHKRFLNINWPFLKILSLKNPLSPHLCISIKEYLDAVRKEMESKHSINYKVILGFSHFLHVIINQLVRSRVLLCLLVELSQCQAMLRSILPPKLTCLVELAAKLLGKSLGNAGLPTSWCSAKGNNHNKARKKGCLKSLRVYFTLEFSSYAFLAG